MKMKMTFNIEAAPSFARRELAGVAACAYAADAFPDLGFHDEEARRLARVLDVERAGFTEQELRPLATRARLVDDVVRRAGEWVPGSGTVVSLLPNGATKVIFFVPEARRASLHPGDSVAVSCTGCPAALTARISRIASEAEYTPPVIYSRETRAKLVWRMEAIVADVPAAPTPGQPVTVRER